MRAFKGVYVAHREYPKFVELLRGHDDCRVSSGYRTMARNKAVGGAPNSFHTKGRAIDIVGPAGTLQHLATAARRLGAVEVLQESDHLHVAF